MAQRSNDERVLNIATALEELNDEVVYVGGSVAQYYSKDAASRKLQTTFEKISMNKKYYVKGNIIVKTPFFSYLNAGAGFETMPEGCEILSETDLEIDDDHPQSFFAEYYAQKDFVEGYIHPGLFWCNFDDIYSAYRGRVSEARKFQMIPCDSIYQDILFRQVYLMIIASVDTYIADTILARVMNDKELFESYATEVIEASKQRCLHRFLLSEKRTDYEKEVIEYILSKSYANLNTIKSLYKNTTLFGFSIDIGQHEAMIDHFRNRHKIAHRNGREMKGTYIHISSNDIDILISDCNKLVNDINAKLHTL